jgi:formylglycine-generating enzyme required for sulfatase activity
MKKTTFLFFLASILVITFPASAGKELPKIAVWDLAPRNTPASHAQELTSILVSEISKLGKYEVYSQDNVRTLAGWTAERMALGCTDTKCLLALGQMDIAKLISGSVGKIGNRYSVSLNLFDTQNARAEKAISEFCGSEDELIELVQQAVRKLLGVPIEPAVAEKKVPERKAPEKTFTNSIGMEFVLIPAGRFMMGSKFSPEEVVRRWGGQKEWFLREHPRHEVVISKPFYLGKFEVTQGRWRAVVGSNPSHFKGDSRPVETVSWEDAQEFVRRLNAKEGTDKYRLPTEAEWEYACRSGSDGEWTFGDDEGQLGDYAWYSKNSGNKTHPVGQKRPNDWGLYDMHGNVWEWCQDWLDEAYYSRSPGADPQGPPSGQSRVLRGGSWDLDSYNARSSLRGWFSPGTRDNNFGLRLARTL